VKEESGYFNISIVQGVIVYAIVWKLEILLYWLNDGTITHSVCFIWNSGHELSLVHSRMYY
jgi:hypothetical protein